MLYKKWVWQYAVVMPLDLEKIRTLREESGKTQAEAAKECGLNDRQQWYQYETGRRTPSLEMLERIAAVLGVKAKELLK